MAEINFVCKQLKDWLSQNLPETLNDLNSGATQQQLDAFAETTGAELPQDFRDFYGLHNGQRGAAPGLFYGMKFLSLEEATTEWNVWKDLSSDPSLGEGVVYTSTPPGAIQLQYINLKWLPFSQDGGGNHLGIDLNPDASGKTGQVINFGRDERNKFVLGQNLADFLDWYVGRLGAGKFEIADAEFQKEFRLDAGGHFFDVLKELKTPEKLF